MFKGGGFIVDARLPIYIQTFLWQMHDYSGEQRFEDQLKINILGIHKILFSGPESKKKMGVDMENMSARSSSYRS